MMNIGIIGMGRFGQLIANNAKGMRLCYYDVENVDFSLPWCPKLSLKEVCNSDIVIYAVPMREFPIILRNSIEFLKIGTLVIDVCSLKVAPCEWMEDILPKHIEILGTHPLFGPQSAKDGLKGHKIVLCPVRVSTTKLRDIEKSLQDHGLKVIMSSPREHDKQMAVSQALTHFIGRAAERFGISRLEMSTKSFNDLMDIIDLVKGGSPELFEDMQILNPFAHEARRQFCSVLSDLDTEINFKRSLQ